LIINEVTSNSLKYAFPDKRSGTIRIEFRQDSTERFHLIISDNGVGFPADFNARRRSSLGVTLIDRLVEQMRGTLERSSSPQGTQYHLSFLQPKILADVAGQTHEEQMLANGEAHTNRSG
jgi:two-component sensor histidine kinase